MNNNQNKKEIKQTRYWCFTLNNYTKEHENILQRFSKNKEWCSHLIYGKEEAPSTETPHLQGGIALTIKHNKTILSTIKNLIGIKELHIEPCRKYYSATLNYIKKLKNDKEKLFKYIYEYPTKYTKITDIVSNKPKKQTLNDVFELAKNGERDKIEGQYLIKYEKQIIELYKSNLQTKNLYYDQKKINNINYQKNFMVLFYGKADTGKTFRADGVIRAYQKFWELYCNYKNIPFKPWNYFKKSKTKWWDDYIDEEIILIEECTPKFFQYYEDLLKEWTDSVPFKSEVKGSHNKNLIRPKVFIFTSNYSLEELCYLNNENYDPEKLLIPLKRRIRVINVKNQEEFFNFPNFDLFCDYFDNIQEYSFLIDKIHNENINKLLNCSSKYENYLNNNNENIIINTGIYDYSYIIPRHNTTITDLSRKRKRIEE